MTAPAKPAPDVTDLTRPFLQAAAKGQLRMQKCLACGHIRFPIGPVCTACLDDRSDWVRLSGHGRVLSHLVFHRGYSAAWKAHVPYSVVMVQLDEGPRMFSDVVDSDRKYVEADLVGRDVQVWFDAAGEGIAVPRFKVIEP
jgi:uncharacterized protein